MSVGLGLSEILVLLAMTGLPVTDAASLIEPAGYLKAHGVELKAERLAELITREARGGKEQMTQLLAIRWLAAHPADAKKAEGTLDALRAVAEGAKGQDVYGFARDHAGRALARIEGKPVPTTRLVPRGSIREALSWFPAEATLFGAVDLRSAGEASGLDPDMTSAMLGRLLTAEMWRPIYDVVDAVGNVRLDRIAFAVEFNEKSPNATRMWIRLTGAGDLKALEAFLASVLPDREERKVPGGEPVIIRTKKDDAPAVVFIGRTDLVIAGSASTRGNHIEAVDTLLGVRAGKGKSVVNGPFAEVLKKVGEKAQGLFVADVPESVRDGLLRDLRGSPFKAVPGRVVVEVAGGKMLTARAQGTMKDAEEAAATAKTLEKFREQAIEALKGQPKDIPPDLAEIGWKALEGAKVEVSGATVTGTAQVPAEALKAVLKAMEDLVQALGRLPK